MLPGPWIGVLRFIGSRMFALYGKDCYETSLSARLTNTASTVVVLNSVYG